MITQKKKDALNGRFESMQKWTIGKKLMASFLVIAGITLIVGSVGYYGARMSDQAMEEVGMVRLPSVASLLDIEQEAERIRGTMRSLAIP
ncbi:MCP four helix bundle domain-containing protein, partial [Balneolaceae bacterium ANBcel3]|nr:MCP four helix bundle domain-containing protein [Balneolaceae bacterium ANBcel3]